MSHEQQRALEELARYFTSANDVPVERATIRASDFWRITGMEPKLAIAPEPEVFVFEIPEFLRDQSNLLAVRKPIKGPCAKKVVRCTLVAADGNWFVGENVCDDAQPVCPRVGDEGYEKCKSICRQPEHAEVSALRQAGAAAKGAHAYVEGITYACRDCQEQLFSAGVKSVSIGSPDREGKN